MSCVPEPEHAPARDPLRESRFRPGPLVHLPRPNSRWFNETARLNSTRPMVAARGKTPPDRNPRKISTANTRSSFFFAMVLEGIERISGERSDALNTAGLFCFCLSPGRAQDHRPYGPRTGSAPSATTAHTILYTRTHIFCKLYIR